jgi:hypothetical protein
MDDNDHLLDIGSLSDDQLNELIEKLTERESRISYERRILHGQIDICRAERVHRRGARHADGASLMSGIDLDALITILAGRASAA